MTTFLVVALLCSLCLNIYMGMCVNADLVDEHEQPIRRKPPIAEHVERAPL